MVKQMRRYFHSSVVVHIEKKTKQKPFGVFFAEKGVVRFYKNKRGSCRRVGGSKFEHSIGGLGENKKF